MTLTTEESLTLQLRRRSFQVVLADHRVQGALIACSSGRSPRFAACACCGYPTISFDWYADCAVCDWEAEDFGETHPDEAGCNSPYSLNAARRNFAEGHTKYRPPDERYARAMGCAAERERIIDGYEALLRDLHPWTFIAALPLLNALYDAVRVRTFGERKPRRWRPDIDDDATSTHDVEVWQTVAAGRRPVAAYRPGPPTFVQREQQLFGTIANELAIDIEAALGCNAPVLASDGPWIRRWTAGTRTASIHKPITGSLSLEFEPESEEPTTTFDLRDDRTRGAIVQRLVAFFGSTSPTV